LDALEAKIDLSKKSIGKKPRENNDEIINEMKNLERLNTTKTQTKAGTDIVLDFNVNMTFISHDDKKNSNVTAI
jgi:hypothetical protein